MPKSSRPSTKGAGIAAIQINARLPDPVLSALDAWIAAQDEPKPSRPEAVRIALTDWLVGQALLRFEDGPEGMQ